MDAIDVEVVPLNESPDKGPIIKHIDAGASSGGSNPSSTRGTGVTEENSSPARAPVPNGPSAFRLKHAGDPQKFKPVEVPPAHKTLGPKGAFQTLKKSYLDTFAKKPKKSSHPELHSSRSLDHDVKKTAVEDPEPSTSLSHASFQKKVSKGFSAQFAQIFKGATARGKSKTPTNSTESVTKSTKSTKPTSTMAARTEKQPKITYSEPNRYFIENYKEVTEPIIFGDNEDLGMRHGVLISNCENVHIRITKKVNKVELDHCKKIVVSVPSVISACDIQHSNSCSLHIEQRCPGFAISNCQSLQLYLPRDNMEHVEIASSGDGSANVMLPTVEDPSEFEEHPIPFQFVHHFKNGKLVSEVSPLYTH
eukprot:Blabericola_migrator_1__7530@NODE_3848_length_1468_cov_203_843683_g2387_i0_p1_GENE_NODE_3848_length_1468_cov_203_843683_g2387_i0NODE_3848_length_1468_cov_203_843683_g2387_i0_p1_ORF_typecomplete_len364_score62_40CAP_C/PF08603_11/1_2e35TBCC/PF07986_12/6_4e07_NODE_3848_length_1468_cov_203_843683_g2387_i02441335